MRCQTKNSGPVYFSRKVLTLNEFIGHGPIFAKICHNISPIIERLSTTFIGNGKATCLFSHLFTFFAFSNVNRLVFTFMKQMKNVNKN